MDKVQKHNSFNSQRVFIIVIYFVTTQSGNFWIHPFIHQAAAAGRSISACLSFHG
jgi:hypothetical protein